MVGSAWSPVTASVADRHDGVVCVAQTDVAQVVERVRARMATEDEKRSLFASGTLSLDLYGLRETLRAAGVETDENEAEG